MKFDRQTAKRVGRDCLIVAAAIFLATVSVRWIARAGSLTPSAAPTSTLQSVGDVYNALAGTYDSSTTTSNMHGNAHEIVQCAIDKVNGVGCN